MDIRSLPTLAKRLMSRTAPELSEPTQDQGALQPIAAKVFIKSLYAARMARFDLLRAVFHLACFIAKWTNECDRRLHRLVCYINSTKSYRVVGWIGDTDRVPYRSAPLCGCRFCRTRHHLALDFGLPLLHAGSTRVLSALLE